jgi:hypothetical protein
MRLLCCSFLCTVALLGQAPTVVPAKASTSDGDYRSLSLFYGNLSGANAARTQALYATSDIPRPTGQIHGLYFRRTTLAPGPTRAVHVTLHIEMSVSPTLASAPSTSFDLNHGANRTVVFDGTIALPATPAPGVWPAAWEAPIQFATPFAYDGSAGNSLVVDVRATGNDGLQTWYAASVAIGFGSVQTVYASGSCLTNNGTYSGSFGYRQFQPYLGGAFSLSLLGYPDRRPSFASSVLLFGFQGPGALLGGLTLPVQLTSLGLDASPSCMLAVAPDSVVPITYDPGRSSVPGTLFCSPFTVPADPTLTGVSFFTQALSVDFENGMPSPRLFPSLALRWTIGSGLRPAASQVVRFADPTPSSATGTVELDQAPVFGLDLR